jgi:putative peptidoglycan lipid II flippase
VGLSGYAAIKVLTPCFYALDRPRTPLNVSLLGIGINVALNLMLVKVFSMGHVGLATTTGILALVNFVQLAVYLRREVSYGGGAGWFIYMISILGASAMCGVVAARVADLIPVHDGAVMWNLMRLVAAIAAGCLGYAAVAYLSGVAELRQMERVIVRRLKGKV